MSKKVAVIIPTGSPHDQVEKCLSYCELVEYPNCTFALVTDQPFDVSRWPRAVNVVTGAQECTGPATKRDFAASRLLGYDVYAYLDADAYPRKDWVTAAIRAFDSQAGVAAVGGPGIMPPDQSFAEALSAACTESIFGGGPVRYRFWPAHARFCDDYPAYNLFVLAEHLEEVGGWGSTYYSGEDTLLCEKLASKGLKIYYDPAVVIYHYRRKLIPFHWQQNFNVGRSRATFIRERASLSMRVLYFAPLVGVLFLAGLLLCAVVIPSWRVPEIAAFAGGYALLAALGHPGPLRFGVRILLPFGLFIHHLAYASGFFMGLLFKGRRNITVTNSEAG